MWDRWWTLGHSFKPSGLWGSDSKSRGPCTGDIEVERRVRPLAGTAGSAPDAELRGCAWCRGQHICASHVQGTAGSATQMRRTLAHAPRAARRAAERPSTAGRRSASTSHRGRLGASAPPGDNTYSCLVFSHRACGDLFQQQKPDSLHLKYETSGKIAVRIDLKRKQCERDYTEHQQTAPSLLCPGHTAPSGSCVLAPPSVFIKHALTLLFSSVNCRHCDSLSVLRD